MRPHLKTLDRVLSRAGVASRSQARRLVLSGRVQVNGRVMRNPDHWVHVDRDRVHLDGRALSAPRKIYLLLHKPAGCVTTRSDPQGRPTVYDLLREFRDWVFPVGRLDLDSSGLLLFTNDTEFADRLTDPRHAAPKTYLVKTAGRLDEEALQALRRGVMLHDGPTRPAQVRLVRHSGPRSWIEITITEGRNRQIRRMIRTVGSKVLQLIRTRIGGLEMEALAPGRYRELKATEIASVLNHQVPEPPNRQ